MLDVDVGDYAEPSRFSSRRLVIRKDALGRTHPDYAQSLNNLALLYDNMGDDAKAEPLSHKALEIVLGQLEISAGVQSERQQLRMADAVRVNLDLYFSLAQGAKVPAEQVYADILVWKRVPCRVGSKSCGECVNRWPRRCSPELVRLFDDLAAASRELANGSLLVTKPGTEALHRQKLADLSERIEQLQEQLAGKSEDFRKDLQQQHRTPAEIRRACRPIPRLVDLLEYTHYAAGSQWGRSRSGNSGWPRSSSGRIKRSNGLNWVRRSGFGEASEVWRAQRRSPGGRHAGRPTD